MSKTIKRGIALAGGGARGAYQIGALEVLQEHGYLEDMHAISGVSVGSLNACALAMDALDMGKQMWLDLKKDDLFHHDLNWFEIIVKRNFKLAHEGIFDTKNLEKIIDAIMDYEKIRQKNIYVTTSFVTDEEMHFMDAVTLGIRNFLEKNNRIHYNKLSDMSDENIKATLLASCAVPIMFKPVKVEGKTYFDGGILDNASFKPLIDEGCNEVIFIDLWRFKLRHFPRKIEVDGVKIHHIYPKKHLRGFMDFDEKQIRRRFELGREDALEAITAWQKD